MSEQEFITGKIRLVKKGTKEELELVLEDIVDKRDITGAREFKTFSEYFSEYLYDEFIITKDSIYEIIEIKKFDPNDCFCNLATNADGTISFTTSFYNGGTCLEEMIKDALEELKK